MLHLNYVRNHPGEQNFKDETQTLFVANIAKAAITINRKLDLP